MELPLLRLIPSPCLSIKFPHFRYGSITALENIDLTVNKGSMTAIVGPNGGGKSTFLKLLAGLLPLHSGKIYWPDYSLKNLAYLPQHHELDRSFPLLAEEVAGMGMWPGHAATAPQIASLLEKTGLSGFEKRSLKALSGGEFQRLLFARLIAQKASVILLDEPFTGIDQTTLEILLALLEEWHQEGKTIMTILHDLNLVRSHFPEVLILSRKIVAHGATQEVLTLPNLAKATYNV